VRGPLCTRARLTGIPRDVDASASICVTPRCVRGCVLRAARAALAGSTTTT
jgi:hypothetical protein